MDIYKRGLEKAKAEYEDAPSRHLRESVAWWASKIEYTKKVGEERALLEIETRNKKVAAITARILKEKNTHTHE